MQSPGGVLRAAVRLTRTAWFRRTLAVVLLVDAAFVILHVAHVWTEWRGFGGLFAAQRFSLEHEGGPSESWEGAMTALCVICLADAWRRTGAPADAALSAIFLLLGADNFLALHERWGDWASPLFARAAAMFEAAPQAFGELSFYVLAGSAILLLLAASFRRSGAAHRPVILLFVALLLSLGAVGAGVDLVHAALGGIRRAVDRLFGIAEDGGELLLLSLACAFAVALRQQLAAAEARPPAPVLATTQAKTLVVTPRSQRG
jgi:hypothetical protein